MNGSTGQGGLVGCDIRGAKAQGRSAVRSAAPGAGHRLLLVVLFLSLLVGQAQAGDTDSYLAQAKAYLASGEPYKALDELKSGVARYPYDQALRHDLAEALVQVAQKEMKSTRYAEAADHFAQARELYPDQVRFTVMRGIALYLAKNYDAARAEFNQAGEAVEPLTYLGKISYDTGDLPAALDYWKRALELEPGNQRVQNLAAKAQRELPVEEKMDKGYSSMFDISFDAELPPGLSAQVHDALESAYNSVGADLGVFPTTRIPVLLYTKSDYSSVTAGPDWSGGLYDGKIRLPVGGVTSVTPQMRGILFHEFTHVLVAEITRGNIPTWLNEGLAQIEEHKEAGTAPAVLNHAVRKGRQLSLKSLSGSFLGMDSKEAGQAYRQSYSLANFMVTRYGWYAMQGILKSLGQRVPLEAAVARNLADWSLDLPAVLQEWNDSLPAGSAETAGN